MAVAGCLGVRANGTVPGDTWPLESHLNLGAKLRSNAQHRARPRAGTDAGMWVAVASRLCLLPPAGLLLFSWHDDASGAAGRGAAAVSGSECGILFFFVSGKNTYDQNSLMKHDVGLASSNVIFIYLKSKQRLFAARRYFQSMFPGCKELSFTLYEYSQGSVPPESPPHLDFK